MGGGTVVRNLAKVLVTGKLWVRIPAPIKQEALGETGPEQSLVRLLLDS